MGFPSICGRIYGTLGILGGFLSILCFASRVGPTYGSCVARSGDYCSARWANCHLPLVSLNRPVAIMSSWFARGAKVAEVAAQYCHKGDPLFVSGRLHTDSWADRQTGEKRTKLKVI